MNVSKIPVVGSPNSSNPNDSQDKLSSLTDSEGNGIPLSVQPSHGNRIVGDAPSTSPEETKWERDSPTRSSESPGLQLKELEIDYNTIKIANQEKADNCRDAMDYCREVLAKINKQALDPEWDPNANLRHGESYTAKYSEKIKKKYLAAAQSTEENINIFLNDRDLSKILLDEAHQIFNKISKIEGEPMKELRSAVEKSQQIKEGSEDGSSHFLPDYIAGLFGEHVLGVNGTLDPQKTSLDAGQRNKPSAIQVLIQYCKERDSAVPAMFSAGKLSLNEALDSVAHTMKNGGEAPLEEHLASLERVRKFDQDFIRCLDPMFKLFDQETLRNYFSNRTDPLYNKMLA